MPLIFCPTPKKAGKAAHCDLQTVEFHLVFQIAPAVSSRQYEQNLRFAGSSYQPVGNAGVSGLSLQSVKVGLSDVARYRATRDRLPRPRNQETNTVGSSDNIFIDRGVSAIEGRRISLPNVARAM